MLTSNQIRQQFLDFFREKKHTIVPSSSLMPDSPNLLFTNAGMNQFVPIFLGERQADVNTWAGAIAGRDAVATRAADTQKCIRAGGKHNDLDDVGLDTYHHTFFEMLGNWSFGDYFKKEAIAWAWELIVERFNFPPGRVYATIYQPDPGDPSERDQEAWELWAEKFRSVGLDPAIHIVNGNKKDNFWMMGETGPCGPCSEIHIDLTPAGDTKGRLVNQSSAECIEIWNNVFIQFNANPDGTFTPLPAQHVDTGMGFERLTSIIQGTKNFTDFANAKISNYETDIFRPIFDELEKMSGHRYASTLPQPNAHGQIIPESEQEKVDVAFRVIADHIRTLSFAIADGIQPGNNDRNYVLRRILRRAVRYGRSLGFAEPFFFKLVDVLARTMGDVFPEIRTKQKHVEETLKREEEAFNRTLDKGIEIFSRVANWRDYLKGLLAACSQPSVNDDELYKSLDSVRNHSVFLGSEPIREEERRFIKRLSDSATAMHFGPEEARIPANARKALAEVSKSFTELNVMCGFIRGEDAFKLYDTYGFPLDLTELMARERCLKVDTAGFEKHMEEQRARARAAQKKEIIKVADTGVLNSPPTRFVGYEEFEVETVVLGCDGKWMIAETTPLYADMGGQIWDSGWVESATNIVPIKSAHRVGNNVFVHWSNDDFNLAAGDQIRLRVDAVRRNAIQRHHTVTHLLHWALHEVVSKEATQKGSFVGPDKLTFDFNSTALTPAQVRDIERLVNERIVENSRVAWIEVPYADVRGRADVMQFFGDKYGETVRVVQVGGHIDGTGRPALDGYSMELCAGTHTRATGEIGLFRINAEAAIAAGVRRIEAVAGLTAYDLATADMQRLHALATNLGTPLPELEKRIEGMLAQHKELEKALKSAQQREAAGRAKDLIASAETINGIPAIIANLGALDADAAVALAEALKGSFPGVVVLGTAGGGSVALIASVGKEHQTKVQAGKIIQTIAPIVGGKGGGKPDFARGGGKDASKLDEALAKAKAMLG